MIDYDNINNIKNIMTNKNTPKTTTNSLKDVVDWLKTGDVVILHTQLSKKIFRIPTLELNRKIYVDVSRTPSLMDDDEWPYYIKTVNAVELENDTFETPFTYNFCLN